ncbi:hypothetical protein C2L64_52400 [Paraburkholderia hospita]|uniref:Uncharacterized protein n=1 Tax=Paraburkholderia hospita TaxID=169430 RepID=A0AAN1MRH5_9BURK|nr:hypothetical protein C2L64_52400 [Paraburkholderia hospita]
MIIASTEKRKEKGEMNNQCNGARPPGVIRVLGGVVVITQLVACSSPPKPPEPTGQWVPVNQPVAHLSRTESK